MRLRAAEVVSPSRRRAEMAPAMRKALAAETDAEDARRASRSALAQLDLASTDRALRLAGGQDARRDRASRRSSRSSSGWSRRSPDGSFVEPDAERARGGRATRSPRSSSNELFVRIARDLFYGLSLGSVLLLAALGLAITFGLMGVINMAHGEMLMLGAYAHLRGAAPLPAATLPGAIDWYLLASRCRSRSWSACCVGMLLERSVIRFLYGRPLETLLATWGISLVLIQTVRLMFGAQNVTVANPSWLSGGFELMSGVVLPYTRLATIVFVGRGRGCASGTCSTAPRSACRCAPSPRTGAWRAASASAPRASTR